MALRIFISYRHGDSAGYAGRVRDQLKDRFDVFMDVETTPLGVDFLDYLREKIERCDVMLALIGPSWLTAGRGGRHCRDSHDDFVYIEIATALERDKPVIPVLLNGTNIPHPDQLPDDLKPLARRNAIDLRHGSFDADLNGLVGKLRSQLPLRRRVTERMKSVGKWTAIMTGTSLLSVAGKIFTDWLFGS